MGESRRWWVHVVPWHLSVRFRGAHLLHLSQSGMILRLITRATLGVWLLGLPSACFYVCTSCRPFVFFSRNWVSFRSHHQVSSFLDLRNSRLHNVLCVYCSSCQMHVVFSIYAIRARFCSLSRNADRLTPTRDFMNPLFGIDSRLSCR